MAWSPAPKFVIVEQIANQEQNKPTKGRVVAVPAGGSFVVEDDKILFNWLSAIEMEHLPKGQVLVPEEAILAKEL